MLMHTEDWHLFRQNPLGVTLADSTESSAKMTIVDIQTRPRVVRTKSRQTT